MDLKIINATIVDGSGGAPFQGEIGVKDGRIAAIGAGPGAAHGSATHTLDAGGALVTPGFIDLHTHYDGQVSWDADLAPSSLHGVTTAVMGNCGVGFAPVRTADRQRLIALMEGVEDIPGTALAEGIRWGWQSFPEYMDAIDVPHAIDFAAQVPHDALRVYVMGDRALAGQAATKEDIAAMAAELRAALEAGAIGFSTGRSDVHRSRDGQPTPASEAEIEELCGLAAAFTGLGHGVLQAVSDFDVELSPDRFEPEFSLLQRMAEAARGHHMAISLSQRDLGPDQWRHILDRVDAANAAGLGLYVQVAPRAIGVILGLSLSFHPLMGFPSYKAIAGLPLAERVAALRTPELRAAILSERPERLAGDGSAVPPLADKLLQMLDRLAFRMFRLAENPQYEPTVRESLGASAMARGVKAIEVLYDTLIEEDGAQLIYFPIYNYVENNLDIVGQMLRHPAALMGLSDGGAHVGTICDASFPTFLLTHWVRDRDRDRISLARAVQMLTADGADYLGLGDRGRLAVGLRADLNVIDLEALGLDRPRLVRDLPAGGQRLIQRARGYKHSFVAGVEVLRDGELTGAKPGRLVRAGR